MNYVQFHPEWETGLAMTVIDKNTGDAEPKFNTFAAFDGLQLEGKLADVLMMHGDNIDGNSNGNNGIGSREQQSA